MGSGNCLNASFDLAMELLEDNPNIRIVHGVGFHGLTKHAFVEDIDKQLVYDNGSQHDEPIMGMPCQEYYEEFGFEDNFHRYTLSEYIKKIKDNDDTIEFFDLVELHVQEMLNDPDYVWCELGDGTVITSKDFKGDTNGNSTDNS